jgi:hypothetical protein
VPKSKTELHHEVWNAFPYMKSIMQVHMLWEMEKQNLFNSIIKAWFY